MSFAGAALERIAAEMLVVLLHFAEAGEDPIHLAVPFVRADEALAVAQRRVGEEVVHQAAGETPQQAVEGVPHREAHEKLQQQRFLLPADVQRYIEQAAASNVLR